MPAFIESNNNDPPSFAKRGRVAMGSTLGHHQQDDSYETVDNARRALATSSSRQDEMAHQIISAPTPTTSDQTDRFTDDASTCQTEGSTFYLHLNDVDDVEHFQPDSEATSSSTSSTIAPLPKKRCLRRRREQRRYPKERHITAIARDLLAQIDDIEE